MKHQKYNKTDNYKYVESQKIRLKLHTKFN